jgi:hypothetical protein
MQFESRGSGLDNGTRRSFTQRSNPPFREGDRIKVVDGRLALLAK